MKLQVTIKITVKTTIEPFVYLFYDIYLGDCFRNVFSKKHRFSIMKQKSVTRGLICRWTFLIQYVNNMSLLLT